MCSLPARRRFASHQKEASYVMVFCALIILALAPCASSQSSGSQVSKNPVEDFDLSGMPAQPDNFEGRYIQSCLRRHHQGDIRDAANLQRRIAVYYSGKGDDARAPGHAAGQVGAAGPACSVRQCTGGGAASDNFIPDRSRAGAIHDNLDSDRYAV